MNEMQETLGFTARRRGLVNGLQRYLAAWRPYELLDFVVVDGSFVTSEEEPADIDMLLVPVPFAALRPNAEAAFSRLGLDREAVRHQFGCDVLPTDVDGSRDYQGWLAFFTIDKQGNSKGALKLEV